MRTRVLLVPLFVVISMVLPASPAMAAGPPALLKDVNPTGDSEPTGITRSGDAAFFAANDGVHGGELWKTDGTTAGTVLVRDIRVGKTGSDPTELTDVNGTLFFVAADGSHGRELWKSDGTATGTVLVKDIAPHGPNALIHGLTAAGDRLYFVATKGGLPKVWVSDGTATGTKAVYTPDKTLHYPAYGLAAGSRFYFVTWLGTNGAAQLWWTDGTTTKRVKGISGTDVGFDHNGSPSMAVVGQKVYLTVNDDLWRTDGTASGTKMILEANLGYGPTLMHALGKKLVFLRGLNSNELWVSNGKREGTKQIYNIGDSAMSHAAMVDAGGWLFIARGYDYGMSYGTLWRTNGTNAGTDPVGFGKYDGPPQMLTVVGDKLCFSVPDWEANDGLTWTLWQTDITNFPWLTNKVATFQMSWSGVSAPAAVLNGSLIFNASDGITGFEPWLYTP